MYMRMERPKERVPILLPVWRQIHFPWESGLILSLQVDAFYFLFLGGGVTGCDRQEVLSLTFVLPCMDHQHAATTAVHTERKDA
jgi:hypothetical protein